ncbi:MAG: L-histidine N(alpha)-methyltransferase [SAR324 cluster bacterium]|nr:L-histidine N(alpha)-methyltransferase [SAR324 cluster bacterium]
MTRPNLVRRKYHERLVLDIMEKSDAREDFRADVELGLSSSPKSIPPKYFYDEQGSRLFEQITRLEAYYPTRTEASILSDHGLEVIDAMGEAVTIVELGSGSSTKTRLLLDILAHRQQRVDYIPIDISPTVVTQFGEQLLADYPMLHIRGLICDYHQALDALKEEPGQRRLFLFLGSSLGNYHPHQATELLQEIRAAMADHDRLLLGLDLKKDPEVLHLAYNDPEGVTAAFNLNLLERINRELEGRFELERFAHKALYNLEEGRIEMYLESMMHQLIPIKAMERSFTFRQGETIHTENSYKFDRQRLENILGQCDLKIERQFLDHRQWFSVNLIAPL